MIGDTMTSFERAKEYVDKAEEYYEMAWQEWEKSEGWTVEERRQFVSLLMKTLDQASLQELETKLKWADEKLEQVRDFLEGRVTKLQIRKEELLKRLETL